MYKHTMVQGNAEITIEVVEVESGYRVLSTINTDKREMTAWGVETYDLHGATIAAFEQVNYQRKLAEIFKVRPLDKPCEM